MPRITENSNFTTDRKTKYPWPTLEVDAEHATVFVRGDDYAARAKSRSVIAHFRRWAQEQGYTADNGYIVKVAAVDANDAPLTSTEVEALEARRKHPAGIKIAIFTETEYARRTHATAAR